MSLHRMKRESHLKRQVTKIQTYKLLIQSQRDYFIDSTKIERTPTIAIVNVLTGNEVEIMT